MKNWLKDNWLFLIISFAILFLAFDLPFFYDYPTKNEYEKWKRNATEDQIYEQVQQFREADEFYAP